MTADSKVPLLPCPFCGGQPEIVKRDVEPQGDSWYGKKMEEFVLCGCGACLFDGDFHEGFYDAETRAPEAWNRRTFEPPADLTARAQWHQQQAAECFRQIGSGP